MLTVFLVTAEANLGEGKMEQMALVCLCSFSGNLSWKVFCSEKPE